MQLVPAVRNEHRCVNEHGSLVRIMKMINGDREIMQELSLCIMKQYIIHKCILRDTLLHTHYKLFNL